LNANPDHSIDYTLALYGKKNKDKALALTVNSAMARLLSASSTGKIQNNGITNFADGLLLKTTMPVTLAETVFITSDAEYALLTDGTGNRQKQIAQQLLQGRNTWFGTL